MTYEDFTKEQLETDFGLRFEAKNLFANAPIIEPSEWLKIAIEKGQKSGLKSEKSRSERIVSPILLEMNELNVFHLAIYSGEQLNADRSKGLNGECDFILSWSPLKDFITAPIFCLTEAERNDLEKGLIQVSAQMLGAKIFNEKENHQNSIYGCATTGVEWRFLKLENDTIFLDSNPYFFHQVPQILGILQVIITQSQK